MEAKNCPHWSRVAGTSSCALSVGGLFIPVPRHVATYCGTSNYPTCAQFQMAMRGDLGAGAADSPNRRRFDRIPGRFQLLLAGLQEEDLEGLIDDSAITVDFSHDGMRLESHQPVPVDSLVSFRLNGDFSPAEVRGFGLVKWCHSLENAPLFHAGIAFTDTLAANAIRRRLAL